MIRTGLLLFALLLGGMGGTPNAFGQAPPTHYSDRLAEAIRLTDRVMDGAPVATLERLGTLLPTTEQLQLRSQRFQTNNYWLPLEVAEIYGAPSSQERLARLRLLKERLDAMRKSFDQAQRLESTDSAYLRKEMTHILQAREYRWKSQESTWQTLRYYLVRALAELTSILRLTPGLSAAPEWLLRGLLLVISFFLGLVVVRRILRWSPRKPGPESRPAVTVDPRPNMNLPAGEFLRRAAEAAGRDDRRLAVRWLFLAALSALYRQGRVRWRPSATNRDLLREVEAGAGTSYSFFGRLAEAHERCWYGKETLGPEGYRDYERSVRAMIGLEPEATS